MIKNMLRGIIDKYSPAWYALEMAEERFEKRLAQVQSALETKIVESKAEVIKWMFIFWAGQMGILFAFFKH